MFAILFWQCLRLKLPTSGFLKFPVRACVLRLDHVKDENDLGEHRSPTPLALELSKVLLYSVQNFFWFPVLFLIAYLHRHMGSPKERSLRILDILILQDKTLFCACVDNFKQNGGFWRHCACADNFKQNGVFWRQHLPIVRV